MGAGSFEDDALAQVTDFCGSPERLLVLDALTIIKESEPQHLSLWIAITLGYDSVSSISSLSLLQLAQDFNYRGIIVFTLTLLLRVTGLHVVRSLP